MKWFVFAYSFLLIGVDADTMNDTNFTFTYEMASHCKEHLCLNGYQYDTFYSISENLKHHNASVRFGVILEMHLGIQASSNGHILLSQLPSPGHNDAVYEIVIGGGDNKFTEIRRNLKRNSKTSKRTDKILSTVEIRGFYIKLYRSGLIEFGQEGAELPLLSYVDIDPLDIQYFSFASWSGVEAKFLYDCPSPDSKTNGTVIQNSTRIERNLSASAQLKRDKLQDRPPHMSPMPEVQVTVWAKITRVAYDSSEAKLFTSMSMLTLWNDPSLAWNPDKYSGLKEVFYREGQVWRPKMHVYNSDNLNDLKTTGSELVKINSDGSASFHHKSSVETWCFSESTTYNRWPRDNYVCTIVIQPWEAHEKIVLSVLKRKNWTDLWNTWAAENQLMENEWELTDMKQTVMKFETWNRIYPLKSNVTHQSDRMIIRLNLQRKPTNYLIAFHTPLIGLMIFVLMSFWGEPLQMARVWFYAGAVVFMTSGLCFIDNIMPFHTVPAILILYFVVLGSILGALILQVMLMTSVADKLCKTTVMENVLTARWFRTVFCLPVYKSCGKFNVINEDYEQQDDEDASSVFAPNGMVEEMSPEDKQFSGKEALASALDMTSFVIYSILYTVMLIMHN